ncbi:hypothetical protein C7410_125107 [Paraburkholderia silvatlantica]|uniref:Uncharacterized protein n=2 Tax=Paraburkholderia silvatlantica TaxID=321895 RepID=A0A2V4TFC0_9BURK|nr:hypothetical protein C7410_125107 [Paraburkholderia silvatlantica]
MNEIFWLDDDLPGTTVSFCSNEGIVAGLSTADVWPLPGVRALTQESQKGRPVVTRPKTCPNPMIDGRQDWLDGLADSARKARGARQ